MTRSLAIETSGRIGSVAIAEDARVLDELSFEHGLAHAAKMVPMIDRLCRQHGWSPGDIRQIYVSIGPGSFTGLRIGVTLAKTMSLAGGAKIVAVPSVRVLAENAPPEARHLIIVLDAKRGQIFTARFERTIEGGPWIEREPAHLDTLTAMLSRSPRPVHLLGEGIEYHREFLPKSDAGVIVTASDAWRGRASVTARLGWDMARDGQFADALSLTPLYIRRPEAEEKADRSSDASQA